MAEGSANETTFENGYLGASVEKCLIVHLKHFKRLSIAKKNSYDEYTVGDGKCSESKVTIT